MSKKLLATIDLKIGFEMQLKFIEDDRKKGIQRISISIKIKGIPDEIPAIVVTRSKWKRKWHCSGLNAVFGELVIKSKEFQKFVADIPDLPK